MKSPKVALVHDYLLQHGGAEKTLEALIELFPDAPIYTSVYDPKNFSKEFSKKTIITSAALNKLFGAIPIFSKYFTFLNPLIFEGYNLSNYDIVISDSSSYAKGVLTKPEQLYICYIHTPPRFLYGYSVENTKRNAWYYKPVVAVVDYFLRIWDYSAAQRPNYLVANSEEIKKRIKKFYRRDSEVIYPPVDIGPHQDEQSGNENYFMTVGRLVAYKNFDSVIKAFNKLPEQKLVIVGTGPEEKYLKKIANSNVKFVGKSTDEEKHVLMSKCKGLINAVKDEDFGIVPIEAMSHGKPVLVHRSAGHLETVAENVTGMFFDCLDTDHLSQKLLEFNNAITNNKFNTEIIKNSVSKYSEKEFKNKMYNFVMSKWEKSKTS